MRNVSIRTTHELKDGKSNARVTFFNGEFDECVFHVSNLNYTFEDWQFLKKIAEFIISRKDLEERQYKKAVSAYQIIEKVTP